MLGDSEGEETEQKDEDQKLDTIKEQDSINENGEQEEECDDEQDGNTEERKDEFTDLTDACARGKVRNLWTASTMTEDQLHQSKCLDDFDAAEGTTACDTSMSCQNDDEDYDDGLSELLNVFEAIDDDKPSFLMNGILRNESSDDQPPKEKVDPTTLSQLSPLAKSTFTSMTLKVESDPKKVELLDAECPNWKENVRFALQQNPNDLREALSNVKSKRGRLVKAMEMLEKQNAVLEVYEMAMSESLGRYDCSTALDDVKEEPAFGNATFD